MSDTTTETIHTLLKRKHKLESSISAINETLEVFLVDERGLSPSEAERVMSIAAQVVHHDHSSISKTIQAALHVAQGSCHVSTIDAVVRLFYDDVREHYPAEALSRLHRRGKAIRLNPRTYTLSDDQPIPQPVES